MTPPCVRLLRRLRDLWQWYTRPITDDDGFGVLR